MSRAYTEQEVRDHLLEHVRSLVTYWENESRQPDVRGKLEGLALSILTALDGEAVCLPGFKVTPLSNSENRAYYRCQGENWYSSRTDVAGCLHEQFLRGKGENKP